MTTIRFTPPEKIGGKSNIEVLGFEGPSCKTLTQALERVVAKASGGEIGQHNLKGEYYQNNLDNEQRNKVPA